jgi:hypothetical protein
MLGHVNIVRGVVWKKLQNCSRFLAAYNIEKVHFQPLQGLIITPGILSLYKRCLVLLLLCCGLLIIMSSVNFQMIWKWKGMCQSSLPVYGVHDMVARKFYSFCSRICSISIEEILPFKTMMMVGSPWPTNTLPLSRFWTVYWIGADMAIEATKKFLATMLCVACHKQANYSGTK